MKNSLIIISMLILGGLAAYYFLVVKTDAQLEEHSAEIAIPAAESMLEPIEPPAAETALPPKQPTIPRISESDEKQTPPLSLEQSDPVIRESIGEVIGENEVLQQVVTENIIAKIVASIDALTSRQLSANHLPIAAPGGELEVTEDTHPDKPMTTPEGDIIREYIMDPINERRYDPYVNVLETVRTDELVAQLQEYQPLFQQSYTDLGYPDARFSTRLLEVIDHLLQTPVPDEPVRLIKPEAYYLFADPKLEELSAGQKLMIRMGSNNAQRVKSKLLEIRDAIELANLD